MTRQVFIQYNQLKVHRHVSFLDYFIRKFNNNFTVILTASIDFICKGVLSFYTLSNSDTT